jgi:O-acetyl-ADP-ribose deacetylase (regulator of RNase III)
MIEYVKANLLESKAQALVNTVNTIGVMGKGIALQFKHQFPENFKLYAAACKNKEVQVGKMFVTEEKSTSGNQKTIINFPTKTDWRKPSEYSYIETGLNDLVQIIQEKGIESVAIPPLGAGNGGLEWSKINAIMERKLAHLDCIVYIYEPNDAVQEILDKECVKLTPGRAMLLSVLFELIRNGSFVSEFSAEKIVYFLQRFGAKETFKLSFQPNFYGPYSGKVKHVLHYLNGSYINGYSAKDKKPFDELDLIMDREKIIIDYLEQAENQEYKAIVNEGFFNGFLC